MMNSEMTRLQRERERALAKGGFQEIQLAFKKIVRYSR